MKSVLVSINSKYVHSSLAVWYLKSAVKSCEHKIIVLESTIKEDTQIIYSKILAQEPELVAFSTYIWNVEKVKTLAKLIKSNNPNITIVLGGPEVSYNCEEVLSQNDYIDYILSGEGEEIIEPFLDCIKNKTSPLHIQGVNSKDNSSQPFISDKEPKSPYTEEYLRILNGRISYIETSRGCPFSCSYCLSGRLCNVRFFNLDNVKKNIDLLSSSGTQTIKFVDRTFNCHIERACDIIEYIISKNPCFKGICYHFEMAGDLFSGRLIELLASAPAGLIQIEVGVQSFNEETLSAVGRKTNISKITQNLTKILAKRNIHIHMDLIAGLPKENFESFRESFNKLFALRPDMLQLGFLKLLHGSPMESQNVGTFSITPPYQIIENDYLTSKDLEKLSCVEEALERLYNSGRFKFLIEKVLAKYNYPFDLFFEFGQAFNLSYGLKLEDLCEFVLKHFTKYIEKNKLLDIMKEQWLMINSSGKFPKCLDEHNMGSVLKELDKDKSTKRKKAVRRAACVLQTTNEIIWVDYENKDIVTGEFVVNRMTKTQN